MLYSEKLDISCSIKCRLLPLALIIFQLNSISNDKIDIFIIIPVHSKFLYILLVIFSLKECRKQINGQKNLRKLKSTDNCVAIESNNSHFQFYFSFAKGQETRKTGQLYLEFAMHYDFLKKWVNKSYGNGSKA